MLLILNPFPILWRKQGSIVTSLVTSYHSVPGIRTTTFPDLFVSGFAHLIPLLSRRLKEQGQPSQHEAVSSTKTHGLILGMSQKN